MLTKEKQEIFYFRLGEYLKHVRTEKKINQETLADYIGLNRVSIVNIERGKQKIQLHTFFEIINYLEIPINDLFDKLKNSVFDGIDQKLEKRIIKKIDPDNIEEINKMKEFVNLTNNLNTKK